MSRLIIKNGRVVDPAQEIDTISDVAIEDGVIREIAEGIDGTGCEVFDASGLIVAPGFVDIHVHLREPGFEQSETIETGSRSAAAGGFTSVACMPNTQPVNDSPTVTSYILERARRFAVVNVYPIGAITKNSGGEELASIASMKQAGIVAISDDGRPVMNARLVRRAMEFARSLDIPLIEHCEDLNLSAGGDMHEGMQSTRLGLRGIPRSSEDVMVARDLILTELTGARYHVAHISSQHSVGMVTHAKRLGLRVTAEATPHHFVLTDAHMRPYDSNYKMKPPLRERPDVEAVTQGLIDGTIDAIATDHAPHPGDEKRQEFERCPFGIIGLETALGLALEQLYHSRRMTLDRIVALFTRNAARVLSLDRGTLRPGAAADVTIFGLEHEWVYDVNRSPSKSRNTPFHGYKFRGGPIATIVGGAIVWRFDS
ncbi:MAG TPA: dihydroorotase [Bryobacteraceae bacterium]|jgi:dihydroorotase|nr:dihydroorotase [Bryobacteraceae bacterium]